MTHPNRTRFPPCTMRCGRGSSAKDPTRSRRSTSTRCSISPPAHRSTASSSTASTCFCSIRTSASTRATTRSSASPIGSARDTLPSARWWRRCGRPPAADRRWATTSERKQFVTQVRKACEIGKTLRDVGDSTSGVIRIDSAASPAEWAKDPQGNTKKIAQTFREACTVAEGFGERLAAEGEICWGGMHSWKRNLELLEQVDRPKTLGFQADMAHTLLFTLGYNAPEDRLLPEASIGPARSARHCVEDDDPGAAAVDHRFPRRAERRDRQGFRLARQDRPSLPARTIRTASWTSPATPASGCATTADSRRARSSTSAGTAACSRTPR